MRATGDEAGDVGRVEDQQGADLVADVAQRLGIIPGNLSVGPSHRVMEAMLPPEWDAQEVYDHHEVLMLHGQKVCHFRNPACGRCVVLDLCPTGQARQAGHVPPAARPEARRTPD